MSANHGVRPARRVRLTLWLAVRGIYPVRADAVLRVVVGSVMVALLLTCAALAPTALNVANRLATAVPQASPADSGDQGLRFASIEDHYEDHAVTGMRVALVGVESATYEGISMPRPGELIVSPEAATLLGSSPELAARYPGTIVGEVPDTYLPGPHTVAIWQGVNEAALSATDGWLIENPHRNPDLRTSIPSELQLGYIVVVLGFVLPLLALTSMLSALGGRRRQERAAALHLLGIPRTYLRLGGLIEDLVLACTSVLAGVGLFWLIGPRVSASLPFGSGIWPQDIALNVPLAVGLGLLTVLVGAAITWRTYGDLGLTDNKTVPRQRRRLTLLASATFALGVLALAASQVPQAPGRIASPLVLIAMPACGLGLVGLLPGVVVRVSRTMLPGSGPAVWASRVIQANPERSSRTASGMSLLLVVSGLMMLFFPLMAPLNAVSQQNQGEVAGFETLVASGEDTKQARKAWRRISRDQGKALELAAYASPQHSGWVYLVDCQQLETVTGIEKERCTRGLVARSSGAAFEAGTDFRWGKGNRHLVLPDTMVESERALKLVEDINPGGGVVLPRLTDAPRPEASRMYYFVAPDAGRTEAVRTQMTQGLARSALTVGEAYAISTYTTTQFTRLLWLAIGLAMVIASLSTVVSVYDRVRATRPERRLLAIAGARPSFAARSIQLQTMVPLLVAVPAAVVVSLAVSVAFVRLFAASGGHAEVPFIGIVGVAALAMVAPLVAGSLILRAESRSELLKNPE